MGTSRPKIPRGSLPALSASARAFPFCISNSREQSDRLNSTCVHARVYEHRDWQTGNADRIDSHHFRLNAASAGRRPRSCGVATTCLRKKTLRLFRIAVGSERKTKTAHMGRRGESRKADEQEASDSGSKKRYAVSGNELIAVNSASSVRPPTKIPSWTSILLPVSARLHLRTLELAKPP